jgi:outer membrane protein TolC
MATLNRAIMTRLFIWRWFVIALNMVAPTGCFKPSTTSMDGVDLLWKNARGAPAGHGLMRDPSTVTLDINQAMELALRQNPQLREQRADQEISAASLEEEAQLKNPELRVRNVKLDKLVDQEPAMEIAIRVPIPQPWSRDARLQRATLRVELSKEQKSDAEIQVRARIQKLFARLKMMEVLAGELDQVLSLGVKEKDLVEKGARDGTFTAIEASGALLRWASLIDLHHSLSLDREKAQEELRALVGLQSDQAITLRYEEGLLAIHEGDLGEDALIKQAMRGRPDLVVASTRIAMAEADVYIAKGQRWPWPHTAEVSYDIQDNSSPLSFQFALFLDVPLFNWNSGAIATREAQIAKCRIEQQEKYAAIEGEIHSGTLRLRATAARVREMQRSLLPSLETSQKAAREPSAQNAVGPLQLLSLRYRQVRAKRRYLKALLEHVESWFDLESAIGDSIPARSGRSASSR